MNQLETMIYQPMFVPHLDMRDELHWLQLRISHHLKKSIQVHPDQQGTESFV
ncbi:hypothetical protein [Aeromonas dhakensis]|uniref:hypothetical protein n=1 Tax=Aeromonas dhakensis TaxID=196024 RepID=UPI00191E0EE1|nr:hypothetical protein [Aeromonas dhakensis]MBL0603530.1 hypothetical protein [Aeromonas dhakensis]MBL0621142.1 hypothetical protein [Aeromonas dhakensis]